MKDTNSPAVLSTYLERYPNGEFASVARALIEHYQGRLELEAAKAEAESKLEAAKKLEEEAKRAADLKRIEDEQKVRQAALAAERKRAEEARLRDEAKRVDKERADSLAREQRKALEAAEEAKRLETERADQLARAEQLRKAQQEARAAREAAKAAEDKRLAALKAAETATKAAEATIAKKREADKATNPTKVAALPKLEKPAAGGGRAFDGSWTVTWEGNGACNPSQGTMPLKIADGAVNRGDASLAPSGAIRWAGAPGRGHVTFAGTLRGSSGSGRFDNPTVGCSGTWTARRN